MATLKDIAEKAGISVGTVDRIMHNRGRFSEDTAEKVRRIARELDYRPNLMARQLSRAAECRIGVFMPDPEQDSGYWSLPLSGALRAATELAAFGVSLKIIHYNRYSSESFRSAGEELLTGNWDGLMMAPLRDEETLALMDRIDSEVPVVFFDTDLPSAPRLGFIGQDSKTGGQLAARLLGLVAGDCLARRGRRINSGGKGPAAASYLIVAPGTENDHLDHRIQGFQEAIEGIVDICRVSVESDHDKSAFRKALDGSITTDTSGIFVIDASAHFVAEYLAERHPEGRPERIPLLGFDLVPANRKWMEEGTIDFLLTQRPVEQGAECVRRLFRKVFEGDSGPDHEFTPIDIITRENLKFFSTGEDA